MSEIMKIVVWDDDTAVARGWQEEIARRLEPTGAAVEAHDDRTIVKEIRILHDRRRSYIESMVREEFDERSTLDDTDVLIVDNDLFELDAYSDLSAETVASRARAYTTCGYVVVLNFSPDVDFDFSLAGHPGSRADLHINERFVGDEGLWLRCPKEDGLFRPWHWPLLSHISDLYSRRVEQLEMLLASEEREMPILDYFGFDATGGDSLSRSARGFLHPAKKAETVSFCDFVSGNVAAIDVRDGETMKDRGDWEKVARICAYRISKWLTHLVLGPQDVLIDLPHLLEKLPFLVRETERERLDSWNSFAKCGNVPLSDLTEEISDHVFMQTDWFDRPVFWWSKFETEDNLSKLLNSPWASGGRFVFCEDSSSFHKAKDCHKFVADHHSTSDTRFARWLGDESQGVNYGPQSRVAM